MVDINIGHQHRTSYLKDMLDINTTTGTLGSRSPEQVTCLEATRTMGTTLSVTCRELDINTATCRERSHQHWTSYLKDMLDINTTTCQEFACAEHWMAIPIPTHSFEFRDWYGEEASYRCWFEAEVDVSSRC